MVRRRTVLQAGATGAVALSVPQVFADGSAPALPVAQASSAPPNATQPNPMTTPKITPPPAALDPVPPVPTKPSPGKPGDFDFLAGEWRIEHLRLPQGATAWDSFSGEATCWTILGGVGSVEELRIPARNFSGMGLRMLDVEKRQWSDFWVNGKSGVLTTPGQNGSFEQGAGLFWSEYEDAGRKMLSMGIWDQIARNACRWRQVVSGDGGKTWTANWIMQWRRA